MAPPHDVDAIASALSAGTCQCGHDEIVSDGGAGTRIAARQYGIAKVVVRGGLPQVLDQLTELALDQRPLLEHAARTFLGADISG